MDEGQVNQISAKKIQRSVDNWRRHLWPAWNLEQQIETYANGGPPPGLSGADSTCEEDMVPLGFAQQFMKKYMDSLLDPLYIEPGLVKAEYTHCKNPHRKSLVEEAVNTEINAITQNYLRPVITNAAGRATLIGRCFLYRRSPNDYRFYEGRIIHPPDAGIDPLSDTFREWAFMDRITLRDLEERLKGGRDGAYGWQKKGLQRLKLWIMAAACEKMPDLSQRWGQFDPNVWLSYDIAREISWEPVDVYWYFRKNGERTKSGPHRGHEKIDMYCISRFGQTAHVANHRNEYGGVDKWLEVGVNNNSFEKLAEEYRRQGREHEACMVEDNERLLFYHRSRFESVEECLLIFIDDARIAGEQRLLEVRGVGRQSMPKLATQETLLSAILEGLTFAAQPHWTIKTGISDEHKKLLERGAFRSFQPFPESIEPMAKNNTWPGMAQALEMVRMLDTSIAADGAMQQPVLGRPNADFAGEAMAYMQEMARNSSRRLSRWFVVLDKIARIVGNILCRKKDKMLEAYPAYPDYMRLRETLKDRWELEEEEWESKNWTYTARKLAGAMERQQVLSVGPMLMQTVGTTFPSVVPFIAKEMLRAVYGDIVTNRLLNPPDEEVEEQVHKAAMNVTISFVTSTPVPVMPNDQPIVHAQSAVSFANRKLQLLSAQGYQTPTDMAGMSAVMQYGFNHASRLPEGARLPVLEQLGQLAAAGARIPVQEPTDPEKEKIRLAEQKLQLEAAKEQRLAVDGNRKAQNQEINTLLNMRRVGEQEKLLEEQQKNLAAQRAKTIVDTAATIAEMNTPPPSGPDATKRKTGRPRKE